MAKNKGFFREMLGFIFQQKKWWLLPSILTLLAVGVLIIFAQSSIISPFIYVLF